MPWLLAFAGSFRSKHGKTWKMLGEGRKCDVQLFEETLTNLHVLAFCSMSPAEFKIRSYSKRDEPTTGADWEWWFGGNTGRWIGLRVQAKVIKFANDTFPHLHYEYPVPRGTNAFLLRTALSGAGVIPVAKPEINLNALGTGFGNELEFLTPARVFEDIGVSAYGGGAQVH